MADRGASLKSNQWSCSELAKGAELAADLAGLALKVDPATLSREDLIRSIQDFLDAMHYPCIHICIEYH